MINNQVGYITARQSRDAREGIVFFIARGACPMRRKTLKSCNMTNSTFERMIAFLDTIGAKTIDYDGGEIVVTYFP